MAGDRPVSYLLDTNVISELRKGRHGHPSLMTWWSGVNSVDVYLSVMVLGEIRHGIERLRLRDADRARELEAWLEAVASAFGARVLGVTPAVADAWGRMGVRRSVPLVDSLLAATAIVNDLVLVTRNTRDIQATGARYLDPFESI